MVFALSKDGCVWSGMMPSQPTISDTPKVTRMLTE